jgi:glycosyltransferase involved in cell wall biosynthesis
MKVAFHVDQLWFRTPGGVGAYVRELSSRLAAIPDVEIVPFRSRWPSDRRATWTVPMGGITTGRHTTHYPLWNLVGWPMLPRALADAAVVHATNHAAVPPARRGQALVVTVHDLAFDRFPDAYPPRWLRLYRAGVRAACRRADAILVPSQATADDVAARPDADPSKIVVTPLAAALPEGSGDPRPTLEALRIARPFVLFVGTGEPRKNVGRLVSAFRRIAPEVPHSLVLAGAAGWGTTGSGAAHDRVIRTGSITAEQLDALYRSADAFCLPSLSEGFGIPVLEAMQRGVPVVTSTAPALAEVADDAALLVDPADEGSIAEALRRVLTDRALAVDLAQTGRERAAMFSWDRTAELTAEVYRSVAVGAS